MSNVADASEGDLSNLSSRQLLLLRRTANAELTAADEAELEGLLAEIPSARDVLAALTDQCEEAAQLKQLSSPLAPPSINLVSSIHQLSELRIKSDIFEPPAVEEEPDLPNLGSASLLIIRKIGHGGMGVVYEAFDQDLGRAVAVKLLTPALSHNRYARELLISEAQSAARLNHENVVTIHSIHLSGEHPYIVQQLVRGETLGQRLCRVGALTPDELFKLTAQLVRGLDAAHAIKLIHRDLKPDNVLLDDETGIARIADFGLAGSPKAEIEESSSRIVGTPTYMSPEQTRGEQLDERSDLFSLGAVLYFAATGKNAFSGNDVLQVLDRVRDSTPVRISSFRNDLPTWWVEPVERLLEKDPRKRYESSTAFSQDIELRRVRAERRQSIYRGLVIGVGVLVLMLGIGGTIGRPIAPAVITNNVPPQPVADKTIWFEIVGDQRKIANMNEAIDAAVSNSVIRLHGVGAIEVKPIVLSAKPLTIEMAVDAAVTVLPLMGTQPAEAFISTDSDLNLRGLRIVNERQNALAMPAGCTVESRGGTLTLDGCLIREDGFAACISATLGNICLTNCQLESGEGLVVVLPQSSVEATISNCWLEGTACFFLMSGNGRLGSLEEPSQVDIDHCTMVGRTLARVWCSLPPYVPIEFSMRDSIDLCQNEVLLSAMAPRVDDALTPDALVAPLKRVLLWHEQHCIHLAGTKFLGRIGLRFSTQVNSLDIKTWDDWCGIWGLESHTSNSVPLSITRDEKSKIVDRHAIAPEFSDCGATLHVDL